MRRLHPLTADIWKPPGDFALGHEEICQARDQIPNRHHWRSIHPCGIDPILSLLQAKPLCSDGNQHARNVSHLNGFRMELCKS